MQIEKAVHDETKRVRGPIDEPAESYGGQGADGNASEHQSDAAI